MTKQTVAVHGVGVVGGAIARYLEEQGHEVLQRDPPKGLADDVARAGVHFLCVPTPFDAERGGFICSYVEEALACVPPGAIAVIKSTVVPGTTARLQQQFADRIVLFSPEFLTAKRPDADLRAPDRQIMGYASEAGRTSAQQAMDLLPRAPHERIIPATEAELVKYFGNAFLAYKVSFANVMFDLCAALSANYDVVKESAAADPRIGQSHLDVVHEGKRGYAGMCLPKDVRALIQRAEELQIDVTLLKEMERRNNELLKGEG